MTTTDERTWSATEPTWRPGTLRQTFYDLESNPLGSRKGENLEVPENYRIPEANVYMVNHSRTRKWRWIEHAVSPMRGAEEALSADPKLAKLYNVDTLLARVARGYDMNRYKEGVRPIVFSFTLGGKRILVPPAKESDPESPPRIEVEEGCWDLFLGNYERLFLGHYSREGRMVAVPPQDAANERGWLAKRWSKRYNPVFRFTIDGETNDVKRDSIVNPFGYLEFVREAKQTNKAPLDREYLTALDLIEV